MAEGGNVTKGGKPGVAVTRAVKTEDEESSQASCSKDATQLDESMKVLSLAKRQARRNTRLAQLIKMTNESTNKFLQNFDPEKSNRERRKLTRKIYTEPKRNPTLYDERGRLTIAGGRDLCDCLELTCPGCFFPCPKCRSNKCGHECRNGRKWVYEQIESEGSDKVIKNPFLSKLPT